MGIADDAKKEMQAALGHLNDELKSIRSGRANPGLLDNVFVEVYGSQMRLADLGNVSAPEPRQLVVTPYDASNIGAIAKGIDRANLSVRVVAEGNVVRVTVPPMDEQMRKEMVKLCHRKCEDGKVSIRNIRRKYNDLVRKKDIPEDELKRTEKKVQELTDDFCKQMDELSSKKEKEILTV